MASEALEVLSESSCSLTLVQGQVTQTLPRLPFHLWAALFACLLFHGEVFHGNIHTLILVLSLGGTQINLISPTLSILQMAEVRDSMY